MALPFTRSADFPVHKAAGTPCPHLAGDFRCSIHTELEARGYVGCGVFDCFGAGQRVAAAFAGRDWRQRPDAAPAQFAMFDVVRKLHELAWHLADILDCPAAVAFHAAARNLAAQTHRLAGLPADEVARVDVDAQRTRIAPVLFAAADAVRAEARRRWRLPGKRDRTRADLAGARLRGADLRGTQFLGALLLGADLRAADLRGATLLGADLRGADLRGADLRDTLFLTSPQVAAARGDTRTALPPRPARPSHWSAA